MPEDGRVRRAVPERRLGRRARRAVLTTHIVAAAAWIGMDVVMGVLVFTAMLTSSTSTEALCYRALELFAVWPLLAAGVATLVSGVVLGLGTNYGLVRYWWVAIKLGMNVLLVTLVAFALRPGVAEAASYGEALAAGAPSDADVSMLFMPPLVSTTALIAATILSVYKPLGRIRRPAG
ncbi:MAG: hypothetical protein GEV08_13190 [Acidimicrobiia bacterium]|nr:hypothetical protein [Acidimicrobiia bacterium]